MEQQWRLLFFSPIQMTLFFHFNFYFYIFLYEIMISNPEMTLFQHEGVIVFSYLHICIFVCMQAMLFTECGFRNLWQFWYEWERDVCVFSIIYIKKWLFNSKKTKHILRCILTFFPIVDHHKLKTERKKKWSIFYLLLKLFFTLPFCTFPLLFCENNLLINSVFDRKFFLKSSNLTNLKAFYCEDLHLNITKKACNVQAGILSRKWPNLEKRSTWARQEGNKRLYEWADTFSKQRSEYFPS